MKPAVENAVQQRAEAWQAVVFTLDQEYPNWFSRPGRNGIENACAAIRAMAAAARAATPGPAEAGRVLQDICHSAAFSAGWWTHLKTGLDLRDVILRPDGPLQELLAGALVAQKLCLTHSEVSEAMEGHRKSLPDDKLPHRSMLEVELADAVIRIADLAGALSLDLGGAIAEKLAYNAQRPDHKPEARQGDFGKAY